MAGTASAGAPRRRGIAIVVVDAKAVGADHEARVHCVRLERAVAEGVDVVHDVIEPRPRDHIVGGPLHLDREVSRVELVGREGEVEGGAARTRQGMAGSVPHVATDRHSLYDRRAAVVRVPIFKARF